MATKFLEPGGDADFGVAATTGFWSAVSGAAVATDFVHGGHIKSIKYRAGNADSVRIDGITPNAGSRISLYIYLNALPTSAPATFLRAFRLVSSTSVFQVNITTAGVLQIQNDTTQIGSDGATLSTGQWYRISLAYTITSSSVNRFELFVDGVSSISITNATLTTTAATQLFIGNISNNAGLDLRSSDHYIDDSNALTDPGNIWVTAKRPNANGTTNGFTSQIGSGGSGYGTGHSPQVNERPLSTTNGWSITSFGATTEEYNIEGKATGDIDISVATIVDFMGWVDAASGGGRVCQIVLAGSTSNFTETGTPKVFTKIAGSSTYPAGTGTDIGMVGAANLDTYNLYECGVIVAYIPAAGTTINTINNLSLLGVT